MGNVVHSKLYKNIRLQLDDLLYDKVITIHNYSVEDFEPFLKSELVLHLLVLLENERYDNMSSIGVDVSCRVIVETMTLLHASNKGLLSDAQKKIFLLSYLGIDVEEKLSKNVHEDVKEVWLNQYNKLVSDYQALLNCSREEAKIISKDRLAFLKYGITTNKKHDTWSKLVGATYGSSLIKCRERASVFIHPSYTDTKNITFNDKLSGERLKNINEILTKADYYIPKYQSDKYVKSVANNDYLDHETIDLIGKIKNVFKNTFKYHIKDPTWENTLISDNSTRWIIFSCFKKLQNTLIDLLICESLGLRNMTVAKSKSFIEMTAMLGVLLRSENIDFDAEGLVRNSCLYFAIKNEFNLFKRIKEGEEDKLDHDDIRYKNYKRFIDEWYKDFCDVNGGEISREDFQHNLIDQQLYFVHFKRNYQFTDLVRESLNNYLFNNKKAKNELLKDYAWSLRVDHACAYKNKTKENKSFNLIPNLISFMLSVFEKINYNDDTQYFIRFFEDYINEYREDNRDRLNDEFFKKYDF